MPPDSEIESRVTVLLIEDEAGLVNVFRAYLEKEGYKVLESGDGKEGRDMFYQHRPDLLILDLMLPGLSGEEVAREVRRESMVPIIMITAKGGEEEKLEGLGIGADDYLVKPVSPRELVARVRTILRRLEQGSGRAQQDILIQGPFTLDTLSRRLYREEEEIALTPTEYRILKLLLEYPRKVFSRENLAVRVFGYLWEGDPRNIDVHIKNLRRKLEPDPKNPVWIDTVTGAGYQWGRGPKNQRRTESC